MQLLGNMTGSLVLPKQPIFQEDNGIGHDNEGFIDIHGNLHGQGIIVSQTQ